jgi:hypothetical protein
MNKKIQLITRIFIIVMVAGIMSVIIGFMAIFILANLGMSNEDAFTQSSWLSSITLGLLVGYKLNDLMRQYKS